MGRAKGMNSSAVAADFESVFGTRRGRNDDASALEAKLIARRQDNAASEYGPQADHVRHWLDTIANMEPAQLKRYLKTKAQPHNDDALYERADSAAEKAGRADQLKKALDDTYKTVDDKLTNKNGKRAQNSTLAAWMARDAVIAITMRDLIDTMDYYAFVNAVPSYLKSALPRTGQDSLRLTEQEYDTLRN